MREDKKNNYDIVILGSGFAGLSTAYHLSQKTNFKIALVGESFSEKSFSGQMTMGGFFDNYTRLVHQWGEEKAKVLWNFSQDAFSFAHKLCEDLNVPHSLGERVRLTTREDEVKELEKACGLLKNSGYEAQFILEKSPSLVLAKQEEGLRGGWIEAPSLFQELESRLSSSVTRIEGKAKSFSKKNEAYKVFLESGDTLGASFLVVCAHTGTCDLIPELKEVLIPYQDESHFISYEGNLDSKEKNLTFSSFHGHIWGVFLKNKLLQIAGARFLRDLAGIGFSEPSFHPKVQKYLVEEIKLLFPKLKNLELRRSFSGLDIRPCDELPLIGPMFGETGVLVGSGFMGQGLTLGLYAGSLLSEYVQKGVSSRLAHNFLSPERFRTFS